METKTDMDNITKKTAASFVPYGAYEKEVVAGAWGKRTLVAGTNITNRGFTMHEHLDEFGLINMNARLYDPVIGQFLSPDPYVQAPEFSQSFNRYAYCLNNPLMYTDPSGEKWWKWALGDVLTGGLISGSLIAGISTMGLSVYGAADAMTGGLLTSYFLTTFPTSSMGYEIQKFISPVAIQNSFGFGGGRTSQDFNFSIGFPLSSPFSSRGFM